MRIELPEFCLVLLVGASGSGKSTFAKRHFRSTEILSSDFCRGLVSDDENNQDATADAFEILHQILRKRLENRRLTVVDATNARPEDRRSLVQLAREYHTLAAAIVLNLPEKVCQERNQARGDRDFGLHVIRQQSRLVRRSLRGLSREGFRYVHVLDSEADIEAVTCSRTKLWVDKRDQTGPFDIIGDLHGCCDELESLLRELGYGYEASEGWRHAEGRRVIFLGDLIDRGPRSADTLALVMDMVTRGTALCVPGNHDVKLLKYLQGRQVKLAHGLEGTVADLETRTPEFRGAVERFLDRLVSHYVLDDGALVVAHAGMKESYQGRASGVVRSFALFGEVTGEKDADGFPIRLDWAQEYRGKALVVYGHTPVSSPDWVNHTINIDTGCVYGGRLTALRYPEKELVSVPALQTYVESDRLSAQAERAEQHRVDDLLDLADVRGKRLIATRFGQSVTIREENAMGALEVMSRFAVNPKWLIYLPPTMSPSETSDREDCLEYPSEAFAYFQKLSVPRVICEEKHMGSRAIVVVCRDEACVRSRFGIEDEGLGRVFTRTGRPFFSDTALEQGLLERLRLALTESGFWTELDTDWVCLDCELMPWSLKAQELLRSQYAAVGAAAEGALPRVMAQFAEGQGREIEGVADLAKRYQKRAEAAPLFREAYRAYCWDVQGLEDLRLAPFHVLATEGGVHFEQDHAWHLNLIQRMVAASSGVLVNTQHRFVELEDLGQIKDATAWWESLTATGGEGMVVKPFDFMPRTGRGYVQPGLKCRGREYLRIIYGPEYLLPGNLDRLRSRGLSTKRSLAMREFLLGREALERFVAGEPLRRVHECVFGVLALETEPVDARL